MQVRSWCLLTWLLLAALPGCAARTPPSAPAPVAVSATRVGIDELIQRGCYHCLERAFAAAQRAHPSQAFEAAALLTLRSKELGLPSARWLESARALAPEGQSSQTFLEIIESMPSDPLDGHRDVTAAGVIRRLRDHGTIERWQNALRDAPGSGHFRAYLDLSLACTASSGAERQAALDRVLRTAGSMPLMQYRAGICPGMETNRLETLEAEVPEFVDADYVRGANAALADDPGEGIRRLRSAAAAFPESPAIAATLGGALLEREEWTEALIPYDAAIALVATRPEALLGRATSLSNLGRHDEAIATATRLIDLGEWYVGQGYYWRARSQYLLNTLMAARSDADRAKALMISAPLFLLSGLIEWREHRLETAEREFEEALKLDFGQCEAALYLGGVRAERSHLPEGIAAFAQARQCFDLAITVRRQLIAKIDAAPGNEDGKARQRTRQEAAIADAVKKRDEAVRGMSALQARQSTTIPASGSSTR